MEFVAYGHPNIRATHTRTIEFTKDTEVSLRGDCIVGVNADFDDRMIQQFLAANKNSRIRITLMLDNFREDILADLNPEFIDNKEIVIRKSDYISHRTLAIKADKAACDLNKDLVTSLQNPATKIKIRLEKL